MKPLLFLLFTLVALQSFAPEITKEQKQRNLTRYLTRVQNEKMYTETIESLKTFEGLRLTAYRCPGHHLTIGYGHLIRRGERFAVITKKQAERLLKRDFDKHLALVDTSLSYNKRLAVAHFIFNMGIGRYTRSKLKRLIDKNLSIDKEIVKWCFYTNKHKKKVRSKWLLKSRRFELNLYNYGL